MPTRKITTLQGAAILTFLILPFLTGDNCLKAEDRSGKPVKTKIIGGVEFIKIPGGSFLMGQSKKEKEWLIKYLIKKNGRKWGKAIYDKWHGGETPRHKVAVDTFWISKYEVTQKQFTEIMPFNKSSKQGDDLPVEGVTWHEAVEFCQKFSTKHKAAVRLPYEAEWEYACRAGTKSVFHWDNRPSEKYGWNRVKGGVRPVGKKLPNKWGLYDMTGNVAEWCIDWYDPGYYKVSPGKNPKGPSEGKEKVIRGDSWAGYTEYTRSASRRRWRPGGSTNTIGFRVVMEISDP